MCDQNHISHICNLVTPKERAKHELLFNERASGQKKVKALTLQTVRNIQDLGKSIRSREVFETLHRGAKGNVTLTTEQLQ